MIRMANKSVKMLDTYIFLPTFNVRIADDILNKRIHGIKFITAKTYTEKYKPLLTKNPFANRETTLDRDIFIQQGALLMQPVTDYLLVRKIKLPNATDQKTSDECNNILKTEYNWLIHFIIACRLYKTGDIQVNSVYTISQKTFICHTLGVYTPLDYIWPREPHAKKFWQRYSIDKNDIKNIFRYEQNYLLANKEMLMPVKYFMQYYSATDLFDKIVKLAIVWETTLLNGESSELNYKLKIRGSRLFKYDISQILGLAYSVRSEILHTGKLKDSTNKKLKAQTNCDDKTDALWAFTIQYLEEITREIIIVFLRSRQPLADTAKQIDQEIFESFRKK